MQVTGKLTALKGLDARLREIRGYLDLVIDEKLPLNHEILYHLQVYYWFSIIVYLIILVWFFMTFEVFTLSKLIIILEVSPLTYPY